MKRTQLMVALALVICQASFGQYYSMQESKSAYKSLSDSINLVDGNAWYSEYLEIDIPFEFEYYGEVRDVLYVNSEGRIGFDINIRNEVLKGYDKFTDAGRLSDSAASPITWKVEPENDQDVLKVEWVRAGLQSEYKSGYVNHIMSMQIWIYSETFDMEIHYGPIECTDCETIPFEKLWGRIGLSNEWDDIYAMLQRDSLNDYRIIPDEYAYYDGWPGDSLVFKWSPTQTCGNGILDGDETSKDCSPGCFECHCYNGIMDADEQGVDCGSPDCELECDYPICPFDNAKRGDVFGPLALSDTVIVSDMAAGTYLTVNDLRKGFTYEFSTCDESKWNFDTQLMLYTTDSVLLGGSEDDCGNKSVITYTADTITSVQILLDAYESGNCVHTDEVGELRISLVSGPEIGCGIAPTSICLVTFDSLTERNLVVWDWPQDAIDEVNIHRETKVDGVYDVVGTVSRDSLSEFIDTSSTAFSRTYKYRLTNRDTCGEASSFSSFHETVLLQASLGVGGEVNMSWGEYSGIDFESAVIWRLSEINGVEPLDTLPVSSKSYSDPSPPISGQLKYQLEFIGGDVNCASAFKTTAKSFNTGRTNTANIVDFSVEVGTASATMASMNLFPNPTADGSVTVNISGKSVHGRLDVIDELGRTVFSVASSSQLEINIEKFQAGFYTVRYTSDQGVLVDRLLIQ